MRFFNYNVKASTVAKSVFPIFSWAREYNPTLAVEDLVAGITVALTLIPQSIAYASLAGLEPQYGLYSSFAGSFVYIFFGTTPEINIGPTALLSLLTFTYTHDTNADFAVLLCFLAGIIQLVVGFSRLGFLVDFVSVPVVSGFTSAAALIIGCAQVKNLLGLSFKAETFVEIWKSVFEHIKEVRAGDALLSLLCCIILLAMRQLKEIKVKPKNGEAPSGRENAIQRALWFTSVGRNAAVVVACTIAAYVLSLSESRPFVLTGNIVSGLPPVAAPRFETVVGNQTYSFSDMTRHLGSGILVVPLIAIIANVAIAKAFSKGKILDGGQEIIALGLCNLVTSFFQSMPCNGSFARSAVSNASGVRTPLAGLYTGIIVLMTLGFLTPYFYFIPKSALASVIVCAVVFMIDVPIFKHLWKSSKLDMIPLIGTFLSCLFIGVELGILIGIAIDLIILLYYNSRPRLRMETKVNEYNGVEYILITPSGGLFFPSANYVREVIGKVGNPKKKDVANKKADEKHIVVIDCVHLQKTDWTSLQGMKSLWGDFKKESKVIIFLHCRVSLKEKLSTELGKEVLHCTSMEELDNTIQVFLTKNPHILETKINVTPVRGYGNQ